MLDAKLVGRRWCPRAKPRLALGHSQIAGVKKPLPPGGNGLDQLTCAGGRSGRTEIAERLSKSSGDMFDSYFFVLCCQPLPRKGDCLWVPAETAGPAAGPALFVCFKVKRTAKLTKLHSFSAYGSRQSLRGHKSILLFCAGARH